MLLADNLEANRLRCGKLGKDPTVETSFLPDRCVCGISSLILSYPPFSTPVLSLLVVALTFGHRSAEDSCSVSERLRSKLSVKGCANSGFVSRSKFEVSLLPLLYYFSLSLKLFLKQQKG